MRKTSFRRNKKHCRRKKGELSKFEMKNVCAEIFDFELKENQVEFQIIWDSIPIDKEDFSVVKIEAEKIWWENCPDMPDP